VLVDEAYCDFAGDDLASFAVTSERTVVLRTLSKAFGLAGLRVGYAVGPAQLVAEIEKSRGPYKVGGVAEAAAVSVLSRDLDWVRGRAQDVRLQREQLAGALADRSVPAFASEANFLLVPVPGTAAEWNRRMRARGVAIRPFGNVPGAGDCIRVSIGPRQMMQRFLAALDEVMTEMQNA
jgi:histidinol-phosphate aminotransferase